jgi:hypothetical protein
MRHKPGETPLQHSLRDDFERLANVVKYLPDGRERDCSLGLLGHSCEAAVAAAGDLG